MDSGLGSIPSPQPILLTEDFEPGFVDSQGGLRATGRLTDLTSDAQSALSISSGLLFANPVAIEHSIAKNKIDAIMAQAIREAEEQGASGSDNTPFVLRRIREVTGGQTVTANRALIETNVIRGTKVAVELAKLERRDQNITAR